MSLEARQQFIDAQNQLTALPRLSDLPIVKQYESEILAAWKAKFPRKKKVPNFAQQYDDLGDEAKAIKNRYLPESNRIRKELDEKRDLLANICDESAKTATVLSSHEELLFSVHSQYTYGSQTNPSLYARTRAEYDVEALSREGISARVVEKDGDYHVMACADIDSIMILKSKPIFSLDLFYQHCKKTGANIRVYYPGLSWDLYP